ncbi:MAG: hypothetical protein ACLP5H_18870, partial [Desulfomonilaceae bacterium]
MWLQPFHWLGYNVPLFRDRQRADAMAGMKKACYNIVQEPREYRWRIEAFVADPGGYAWNLITLK